MKHQARAQKRAAAEMDAADVFTVGKLADLYLAVCKHQREVGEKARVLNHEDYSGLRKLEALRVTRHDAIEALARVRSRAKVQYNRTRAYFRAMYEWGMTELRELDGLAGNPFARVPIEKAAEKKKDRALSFTELVALLAVLDGAEDQARANVLRLVALTGLRPGYVCSLQWRWLDLESNTPVLRLPKTKNERAYTVRLSEQVVGLFGTIHRSRSPFVFHAPTKAGYLDKRSVAAYVRDEIAPLVKVEGKIIPAWTPHDLRRSVGTRLQQLGYRKELIDAAVLHHVEPGVKGTYLRYEYVEEGGAAIQHLANHLESLRSATNVVPMSAGRAMPPAVTA
jgi:integrase